MVKYLTAASRSHRGQRNFNDAPPRFKVRRQAFVRLQVVDKVGAQRVLLELERTGRYLNWNLVAPARVRRLIGVSLDDKPHKCRRNGLIQEEAELQILGLSLRAYGVDLGFVPAHESRETLDGQDSVFDAAF